jgi:IS4 transposase
MHQRLTGQAAEFLRRCYVRLSHRANMIIQERLPGPLAPFKDIMILDSSVVGLAKRLASVFPACRTNSRKAALKVHALMSLAEQQASRVTITGERVPDGKVFKVGKWVRDRLLIFDLAYLDYGFLGDILRAGGAYACRLKTTSNGTIVAVRQGCSNRAVGGSMNRLIYRGPVVDLDVCFGRGCKALTSRVIGIWNVETEEYHWYTTSLESAAFPSEEVAEIYRLRWQIELLFKEWKSLQRLGELPSGDESIVKCLLYATLCASVLSRLALWMATHRFQLPWFEMSTPIAVTILAAFSFEFAREALKGRSKGLRSVLSILGYQNP